MAPTACFWKRKIQFNFVTYVEGWTAVPYVATYEWQNKFWTVK